MTNGAVASVMQMDTGDGIGMVLQIVGTKMDGSAVTMQFPISSLQPGTYTFSGMESDGLISYMSASQMYDSSGDGGTFTLDITEFDLSSGRLSGIFSGTLTDFMGGSSSVSVTEGHINHVLLIGSSFHSGGEMSVSRNGGTAFTMDDDQDDAKYMLISENTVNDAVSLIGYNQNLGSDYGIYTLTFPNDVTPGTYDLEDGGIYSGNIGNSDSEPEYHLTSGSMTVTSHSGNHVVGTFHYNVSNGVHNVAVSNGTFDVTLQ